MHFSKPSINKTYNEIQKNLGIQKLAIIKLSDTRWNCRYRNCEAVKKSFKAIILALEQEIEDESDRDVNEAIGIFLCFKLLIKFIVFIL